MRASILIGTHNEGDRLWRTVESILESDDGLDSELIVADDASTDGSIGELKRRFPRVQVVRQAKRSGVSATRALAASRARGVVLVFLDGHTRPEPGALKRLVEDVVKTRGLAIVTPQIVGLDEISWKALPRQTGNGYALDLETFDCWWSSLKKMKEVKEAGRTFFESPAFIGCAFAISRQLYEHLWGFDQHMRQWGGEDLDFALKAWTMGYRILHDPEATVAHRFQRVFSAYEVDPEYPLANQIRTARKHFTPSVWKEWLERAQHRHSKRLKGHPEGLWARAWQVFEENRKSADHERAYLLSRRPRDEFWYAKRFERSWPTMGGANLGAQADLPPFALEAFASSHPCHITSQTVATQPSDQTRTTIGIGEEVDLTFSQSTATWTPPAHGTLSTTSGKTTRFTADGFTGTVTIAATGPTGCEAFITFTVIAPNSVVLQQSGNPIHHVGQADIGLCISVFIGPDTVNFYNVWFREDNTAYSGSGIYLCQNMKCHCATCGTDCPSKKPNGDVVSGAGSSLALDKHYATACAGVALTAGGTKSASIPVRYSLDTVTWVLLDTQTSTFNLATDGVTLSTSKTSSVSTVSATLLVSDATTVTTC